jgi:conjugal transfer pilus assembly protein TraW
MKDAVRQKMANGGRDAMLKAAQERYLASLENIATPAGVSAAKVNATRLVDLTHTVTETITDGRGSLVVAAGTKINPLAVIPMTKKLFFIDAKDPKQIRLAKTSAAPEDKIILLGGSVFKASHALGRNVYLDVPGLHTRMKIKHLPSVVSQEGVLLKVQEIVQ